MGSRAAIEAVPCLLGEAVRGRGIEGADDSRAILPGLAGVPDGAGRPGLLRAARSAPGPDDRWRFVQLGAG